MLMGAARFVFDPTRHFMADRAACKSVTKALKTENTVIWSRDQSDRTSFVHKSPTQNARVTMAKGLMT